MLPDGTHRRQVTSSAGELSWGSTPLQCKVPDVRSRSLAAARRAIVRDHCTVGRTTKARSTSVPRGEVISERPAAGTFGQDHAKVGLILSAGPRATGRTH
jgi:beta-lactam-binding protein with PASTA domain